MLTAEPFSMFISGNRITDVCVRSDVVVTLK